MDNNKTCGRCKQVKPASNFYQSKRRPDGLRDWCKTCETEYNREYVAKNKDKVDANRRQYWDVPENRERRKKTQNQLYHEKHDYMRAKRKAAYHADPEPVKEQTRLYREQNPEKVRESSHRTWQKKRHIYLAKHRQYRQINHDRLCERQRQRYAENPEPAREQARAWRRANPDKRKVQHHRRRAHKVASGGSYTTVEWRALCDWFGDVCLACGERSDLTVDHVIPISRGGSNAIDNLQPLCLSCNSSKKARTTDYRPRECLIAFLEYIRCGEY